MVYNTCLRILGNSADAEDAAQATFVVFLKKAKHLKHGTKLAGWLYRTAKFVSREHLRAQQTHKNWGQVSAPGTTLFSIPERRDKALLGPFPLPSGERISVFPCHSGRKSRPTPKMG